MKATSLITLTGAAMFGVGLFSLLAPLGPAGFVLLPLGGVMILWVLYSSRIRPVWVAFVGGTIVVLGLGWTAYYSWILYPKASCVGIDNCLPPAPLLGYVEFWVGLVVATLGIAIILIAVFKRRKARRGNSMEARLSKAPV
jgi:hypothetical protein